MPILQPDPWRQGFFDPYPCPDGVVIPTKDPDAYQLNPGYQWAYDKLQIAKLQGLRCAPHGVMPDHYPVFSKPIYNLRSMGAGSGVIASEAAYAEALEAGYMWVELLTGDHYSTDVAVVDGNPVWLCHTLGIPLAKGTFDYWEVQPGSNPGLDSYLTDFITAHFQHYTGMLNFETIGGRIIEMHLRFADQWPDLYGTWFVPALIGLYANGEWPEDVQVESVGYSVVLFDDPRPYVKPEAFQVQQLMQRYQLSSIQLSFDAHKPIAQHSMPPGGFRIAIINGLDLEKCSAARTTLQQMVYQATGLT